MVTLADARTRIEAVVDPELPFVTIAELGILRDVAVDGDQVTVTTQPRSAAKRRMSSCCASSDRPCCACMSVETRQYP